MAVKKDERMVHSKKNKDKMVKKITYKCEGSYVDLNGTPHRYHKRGFASSAEAAEWEREFLLKMRTEIDTNMTMNDVFVLYLGSKKNIVKDRTYWELQKTYKRYLYPYWGDLRLRKIRIENIHEFQSFLLNAKTIKNTLYSNAMISTIQTRLKSILRYASHNGYISDPKLTNFNIVKRSNEPKKEMCFWHPNEYKQFISVVDDQVYIALFNVLYWCGLRIGEALALRWSDVDLKAKTISISKTYTKHRRQTTTPKTRNSYRAVIMPNECFLSVQALYERHSSIIGFDKDKLLFNFDKPLDDNSIRLKKDKWIAIAKVPRIRIHDFRHSHVSLLINLGFSPFDIAKRLGHTVEMVNDVYGHWFDDAQQKMVDKLNTIT